MNKRSLLAFALLASISLAACSNPAPATGAGTSPSAQPAHRGIVGEQVDRAMAEARRELRENNLSLNSGVHINVNGHEAGRPGSNLPKAEISPQGDLLIDGKAVAISNDQRSQLLSYRNQIIGIAEAGMDIGSKGVDIAGTALQGVGEAIFGGEQGQRDFEARMEAEGKKIEAQAQLLCNRLPPLLVTQNQLAASLPEFKPYATMTQADIDDCGKDEERGAAVTSD